MNQAIQRIAAARPWVIAAVVVAVALVVYFAGQGYRYYEASEDKSSARDEISRLQRTAQSLPAGTAEQEAQLVANLIRLEELYSLFDYPDTDTLLNIVSETARDTGIDLRSISVGGVKIEPLGTLQYQVQPISVSISGPVPNIQGFLSSLREQVPVVAASSPSISNLQSDPVSQLQLRCFLSPEPIPQEDG